ncbi:MAG: hypothetical protein CMC51_03150 [Flavobacteriaceae bacterium]|nr:hypothetical protein [Flavobacteriaceae bacterium]|tara:strand:+ start:40629 stop:41660 length:1032 start_codon:yes stop_codon:yes gene_type:complete
MQLYNKLSADERSKILESTNLKRITLSFYQYAKITDPKKFRDSLFIFWDSIGVLGRIYVANEGINAQLSLPEENIKKFTKHLNSISFLKNIRLNIALKHEIKSFLKLKIKVKNKILADGLNDKTFDVTKKGIHLNAADFNKLMKKKDSIILDMRNHYESEIGHFKNAICPNVDTFRDSLDVIEDKLKDHKEDRNLLMYCTGGIRCEKASAYFKHKGFKNVYQLEGGIIEYVRQTRDQDLKNNFIGKNFVFDNRRVEKVSEEIIAKCHQCGIPFDIHTNCANDACHLLFIQCDKCKKKLNNCCSNKCYEINQMPYVLQKQLRKGQKNSNDIFKKGRTNNVTIFK